MDKEIRIDNLTLFQTHLLDKIWAFENRDELVSWLQTLPSTVLIEAVTLVKLLEVEALDQQLEETEDYTDANELIMKFML